MTRFEANPLLPDDDDVVRPVYRVVWRPAVIEMGILLGLALLLLLFAPANLASREERTLVAVGLALLPVAVWGLFSWRAERGVQQPRPMLGGVFVMGLLVGNALTAPFIEGFIEPAAWLTAVSGASRIAGYTVTVGLVTEFSKLLVLRYLVWPYRLRRRVDAVAYSLAVSLGMATVFNLRFALIDGGGQPGAAAVHVVSAVLMQQAIGLAVALGLNALKGERAPVMGLSLSLLVGALLHGLFITIRAGFVVRGFGINAAANSPFLGLVFAGIFALLVYFVVAFLIANADARDQQLAGRAPLRFMR